jgi:hypothetical protein
MERQTAAPFYPRNAKRASFSCFLCVRWSRFGLRYLESSRRSSFNSVLYRHYLVWASAALWLGVKAWFDLTPSRGQERQDSDRLRPDDRLSWHAHFS